jgi:hypothetical protein
MDSCSTICKTTRNAAQTNNGMKVAVVSRIDMLIGAILIIPIPAASYQPHAFLFESKISRTECPPSHVSNEE